MQIGYLVKAASQSAALKKKVWSEVAHRKLWNDLPVCLLVPNESFVSCEKSSSSQKNSIHPSSLSSALCVILLFSRIYPQRKNSTAWFLTELFQARELKLWWVLIAQISQCSYLRLAQLSLTVVSKPANSCFKWDLTGSLTQHNKQISDTPCKIKLFFSHVVIIFAKFGFMHLLLGLFKCSHPTHLSRCPGLRFQQLLYGKIFSFSFF